MSWHCAGCKGNFAGCDTDEIRLCEDCAGNSLGERCKELLEENLKLQIKVEEFEYKKVR